MPILLESKLIKNAQLFWNYMKLWKVGHSRYGSMVVAC